jgi:8-oxo-dGTP pyrophosphatase MutT (NUDIX family)
MKRHSAAGIEIRRRAEPVAAPPRGTGRGPAARNRSRPERNRGPKSFAVRLRDPPGAQQRRISVLRSKQRNELNSVGERRTCFAVMATDRKIRPKSCKRQFAALPCAMGENGTMVMLVTSRETGRWVLPKGWPIKRLSGRKTAAREAFEEAGLVGPVARRSIGFYRYPKRLSDGGSVACAVDVFPMRVAKLLEDWPERTQRQRRWFTLAEAAGAVHEGDLTELLLRLAASGVKRLR